MRPLVEADHAQLSVRRQCQLLGLNRASFYYQAATASEDNLRLMRLLDAEYTRHPFYGSRKLMQWLRQQGEEVNRKRVQRLWRDEGLRVPPWTPKRRRLGESTVPAARLRAERRKAGQEFAAEVRLWKENGLTRRWRQRLGV